MSGSAFNGFPLTGNESVIVSPPVGLTTTQAIANLGNNSPSAPTITGGTINGAVIGGTSPAAGHFTTLSATGASTLAATAATTLTASTSATISADNGLKLTSQTSDAGAATATMTNGPTAGNPAFWLRITINGTNVAIPAWTAV